MITQNELKQLLTYDPDTGVFTRRVNSKNHNNIGQVAGSINSKGYRIIKINGEPYKSHRLALLYMNGNMPIDSVDHINGNRDDNRFVNLRECTNAENCQNRGISRNNTSGYAGVSWHNASGKWHSSLANKYLGLFNTREEAHEAYLNAKAKLHTFQPIPR
jgi:hypothetical protein